jgi:hypothetical protein
MLIKYNLLSKFTVKAFATDILDTAYSVLGSDIYAYIGDSVSLEDMLESEVNSATCIKGLELQFSSWTAEKAQAVINAGYIASAWNVGRKTSNQYKELIKMGVTQFVDDFNCSYGLSW